MGPETPFCKGFRLRSNLLTTHHRPADRTFTTMNMTSAATALASRFAARVMAVYPYLWPETIRALIVHSAEWTDQMRAMHLPPDGSASKQDHAGLLRRCGFGVPDLGQALWSVRNSLAMVVEERIQPYRSGARGDPVLNEMQLHSLPWPTEALLAWGTRRSRCESFCPTSLSRIPLVVADPDTVTSPMDSDST